MMRVEHVWICHGSEPRPKFHALDDIVHDAASRFHRVVGVMKCGHRDTPSWWTGGLRRDHAEMFADPCKRCYPTGSEVPS